MKYSYGHSKASNFHFFWSSFSTFSFSRKVFSLSLSRSIKPEKAQRISFFFFLASSIQMNYFYCILYDIMHICHAMSIAAIISSEVVHKGCSFRCPILFATKECENWFEKLWFDSSENSLLILTVFSVRDWHFWSFSCPNPAGMSSKTAKFISVCSRLLSECADGNSISLIFAV